MLVSVLKKSIHVYHWLISPLLGTRCRYAPSCSEYAIQALDLHGVRYGTMLTIRRLCQCHPWGGDGYDPVPENIIKTEAGRLPVKKIKIEVETELEN